MQPNKEAILNHLTTLFSDTPSEHSDGLIEIAYSQANTKKISAASYFTCDEIQKAADFVFEKNAQEGVNVYVGAALRIPDRPTYGRSSSADYYSSGWVWADLDDPEASESAKEKYDPLPPSCVVVTGRAPHKRFQAWWKISEWQDNQEELTNALAGVTHALNGDPSVVDAARVMRVGGSVAWPKKEGRVTELTEFINLNPFPCPIEHIKTTYPPLTGHVQKAQIAVPVVRETSNDNPLNTQEHVTDGRDKYMSDMIFASILNLTATHGCFPTGQEVFDDCWPVYEKNVSARDPRGLEAEDRGANAMSLKITSKLKLFEAGRVYGYETLEKVIEAGKSKKSVTLTDIQNKNEIVNPETGEVTELAAHGFELHYASEAKPILETNDFVEDVLREGEFSVIYGESNCGKTFFMLDLAMHVALGKTWRDKQVEQGGVIYAALEGGAGTNNRICAFNKHYGIDQDVPFATIRSSINFLDIEGDIQKLALSIEEAKKKMGGVKLIVIDTLARAISGGDENSGQDMGMMVSHSDYLRGATGAHISFIHHSGKDKALGARGHSSLRAAVDTEIEISRADEKSPSLIKIVKQREMEMIDNMQFRLQSIELGVNKRSKVVTSCVVIPEEYQEESKDVKLSAKEKFVYEAIVFAIDEHGYMKQPFKNGSMMKCITYHHLAITLDEMGFDKYFKDEMDEDSAVEKSEKRALKATREMRIKLRDKNLISFNGGLIWLLNYED